MISLCCHGACCLLSITEWAHHTTDSVSTTAGRRAGKHDGWVDPSDSPIGDQILYEWTKLASATPMLEWFCIRRMKYACIVYLRKINFIPPICRSIGTMGLQALICSPSDIPSSPKLVTGLKKKNVSPISSRMYSHCYGNRCSFNAL